MLELYCAHLVFDDLRKDVESPMICAVRGALHACFHSVKSVESNVILVASSSSVMYTDDEL